MVWGVHIVLVLYTALGAVTAWMVKGRKKLVLIGLSDLCKGVPSNVRVWLEFLVFVVLGCIIGMVFAHPATSTQAMTAGLSWTGLMTGGESTSGVQPSRQKPKE
jgi:hypothetical protein